MKGCSMFGCLICTIIALIVGALTVWIFYPYLEEKGYTPLDFSDKAIEISKTTARTADKVSDIIEKNAEEARKAKVLDDVTDKIEEN